MWWLEWYGDWGSYILYNPHFHLLGWRSTLWTTPNKPIAVFFAYGWYYALIFPAMLALVGVARRRWPTVGRTTILLAVATVSFYIWDLLVEGGASLLGWWSYVHHVGPAVESSKGSFPLLYPILLFTAYGVAVAWVMDQRDAHDEFRLETLVGIQRIKGTSQRETARVLVWSITLNVMYIVILIAPLIAIRSWFGPPSHIVL
jgi:hypothetical protein